MYVYLFYYWIWICLYIFQLFNYICWLCIFKLNFNNNNYRILKINNWLIVIILEVQRKYIENIFVSFVTIKKLRYCECYWLISWMYGVRRTVVRNEIIKKLPSDIKNTLKLQPAPDFTIQWHIKCIVVLFNDSFIILHCCLHTYDIHYILTFEDN